MRAAALHPYVEDALRVYERELDPHEAVSLIAKAGLEGGASLLRPHVEDREHPDRAILQLWFKLWAVLAKEHPELFRNGRRLDLTDPYMLMFAYALKRQPEVVPRLHLTAHEQRRARKGRKLLHELTGLESFRRPCNPYVISREAWPMKPWYQPLVHSSLAEGNAWAVMDYPDLFPRLIYVDENFVDEARAGLRHGPDALVATLFHEEIHWAVTSSIPEQEHRGPLSLLLSEPAAMLGALWVDYMLDWGEHHTGEPLTERASVGFEHVPKYGAALRLLISDDLELDEGFLLAVKIGQAALRIGDRPKRLARELSALTGRTVTPKALKALLA